MQIAKIAGAVAIATGMGLVSAQAADRLFFEADMVRGIDRKKGPTGPVCVLASSFRRGEMVVWRARIHDPAKPKQLEKADLKSVHIELPDGSKHAMRFGGHPPKKNTDHYWTAAWIIPAGYPTGSFSYKIVAVEASGKTHSWTPFNIKSSDFTVVAAAGGAKK